MKTLARILFIGLGALLGLIVLLLIIVRLTIGAGEDYEDLSTEALFPESELEVVATMDMPLGNPAVSADGRIFFNLHPLAEPEGATVFEWIDGQAIPYPDAEFQTNFRSVLGMFIDSQNRLWTLDNSSLNQGNTRLLAFDLESNEVVHDHTFGDDFDFLNDLQVSPDGQTIYFSDPGLFFLSPRRSSSTTRNQAKRDGSWRVTIQCRLKSGTFRWMGILCGWFPGFFLFVWGSTASP